MQRKYADSPLQFAYIGRWCGFFMSLRGVALEKSYHKRYQASLIENSRFVQAHGLEHFMEQQKAKYTCPKCGGIVSMHDRECSECQEKMK